MRSKKFRTLRFAEKDTDVRYQHAQRNPSKSRHENMTIYNYHTKYLQVTCQNQDRWHGCKQQFHVSLYLYIHTVFDG